VNYFRIENLDQDEVVLAWPLVRSFEPALELHAWRARAEVVIDGGGGIIAAQSADGIIHGLATYEVVERPTFGSVLDVATFVTFELTRQGYARRALLDRLNRICRSLGCVATVISEQITRPMAQTRK
jgi:GNAT superfamily N-acetyltransferase